MLPLVVKALWLLVESLASVLPICWLCVSRVRRWRWPLTLHLALGVSAEHQTPHMYCKTFLMCNQGRTFQNVSRMYWQTTMLFQNKGLDGEYPLYVWRSSIVPDGWSASGCSWWLCQMVARGWWHHSLCSCLQGGCRCERLALWCLFWVEMAARK